MGSLLFHMSYFLTFSHSYLYLIWPGITSYRVKWGFLICEDFKILPGVKIRMKEELLPAAINFKCNCTYHLLRWNISYSTFSVNCVTYSVLNTFLLRVYNVIKVEKCVIIVANWIVHCQEMKIYNCISSYRLFSSDTYVAWKHTSTYLFLVVLEFDKGFL